MRFLLLLIVLAGAAISQDLFINEFMAANQTTITDPDFGQSADWIEIYNAADSAIDLSGYYLTDDLTNPDKWQITSPLVIGPNEFQIIWADGADQGHHAGFNLAREGESIGLYDPGLRALDTLSYTAQMPDISIGRYPDGGEEWLVFQDPSPGQENGSGGLLEIAPEPVFSHAPGLYYNQINVEISSSLDSAQIYYTRDGSVPTSSDILYTGYINIRKTTVLRAVVHRPGYLPGPVKTVSYMMFMPHTLPVISLATDPANFFDDQTGIYVIGTNGIPGYCSTEPRNWNQDWERPIHVELFEPDGRMGISQDAGVKIGGACTRLYPQKSLELNARKKYGDDRFRYRLYADKPIQEFESIKLRSSAQDWWRTMFRDGMINTLVSKSTKLDYQAYQPSVVYLNGEYWGIHNIREKGDEYFIYSNYGLDPNNLDIIKISKSGYATAGDIIAYTEMMDFVESNDLGEPENYARISGLIDIDNYIDYQIFEIYIANRDWPGNNVKLFRQREPGTKWRWLLYDLDMGFGGNGESWFDSNTLAQATEENGPAWPNPPWSTLLFRRLLENEQFRNLFIQRFMVFLSYEFTPQNIFPLIDSLQQNISGEIPRHKERWPKSISFSNTWQDAIKIVRDFTILRPQYMRQHLAAKFNLNGTVRLIVEKENAEFGRVEANNVLLRHHTDTLTVFKDIPLDLMAQALPGYRFDGWSGDAGSLNRVLKIIPDRDMHIRAVFQKSDQLTGQIVLNEINYNSPPDFDPGDWAELYNHSDKGADLSGYWLQDMDAVNRYVLPAGTILAPGAYLVICRDSTAFRKHFPLVKNVLGDIPFGFDARGDHLRLCSANGTIVDSLSYGTVSPWPESPDGWGPTLALRHPDLDNSDPRSWQASQLHGTPGYLNDVFLAMNSDMEPIIPDELTLVQNYPNPFNNSTTIAFYLPESGRTDISIYNINGERIDRLTGQVYQRGLNRVHWTMRPDQASGIYFYFLRFGREVKSGKLVYIK